jgi:pimeloyl-ACP methyl ester carboxylesterase
MAAVRADGYDFYIPTLTGLGERAHLARPEIGLGTHIADVVNLLKYEDLSNVVLVGNSSGGMVITGVADQLPAHLTCAPHSRMSAKGQKRTSADRDLSGFH